MPFASYEQDQLLLLPPSLEELIPENDLVRVISKFIDSLPKTVIEQKLEKTTGRPLTHPRMMLKVIIYAYCQRIFSCRKIAKAMRQNVCFMWLAAMEMPDFNTVNRFRSDHLAKCLEEIFPLVAQYLLENDYIRGEDYFVDGTKIEADANPHSYVWAKNVERFKESVSQRAVELIEKAHEINTQEDQLYGDGDLPEVGEGSEFRAKDIEKAAQSIGRAAEKAEDKKVERDLNSCKKKLEKEAEKMTHYEKQEEILGSRNSYSKTDPDATFMRMKNGQLLPAYNVQIGTENGFVIGYFMGQNANDATSLIPHLESRQEQGLPKPFNLITDAGYGNEETYTYIEKEQYGNYVKYPSWYRETKGKLKEFEKASFTFDQENNSYTCPQDCQLPWIGDEQIETKSGYTATVSKYQCESCEGCPVREKCVRGKGGRTIQRSEKLEAFKDQVRENLETEKGEKLRKKRGWEAETPFGHIKHNLGYRRIRLRGMVKATAEMIYLLIGMNLNRVCKMAQ